MSVKSPRRVACTGFTPTASHKVQDCGEETDAHDGDANLHPVRGGRDASTLLLHLLLSYGEPLRLCRGATANVIAICCATCRRASSNEVGTLAAGLFHQGHPDGRQGTNGRARETINIHAQIID